MRVLTNEKDNIILFPADKIVKTKKEEEHFQNSEQAKEVREEQTKNFVESQVDVIAMFMLQQFVDMGIRTDRDKFTGDLALVTDTLRGLIYRDFETYHPAQLLSDKMVYVKHREHGPEAKIDYSQAFISEKKDD